MRRRMTLAETQADDTSSCGPGTPSAARIRRVAVKSSLSLHVLAIPAGGAATGTA
jgi:hypothetical protein